MLQACGASGFSAEPICSKYRGLVPNMLVLLPSAGVSDQSGER